MNDTEAQSHTKALLIRIGRRCVVKTEKCLINYDCKEWDVK